MVMINLYDLVTGDIIRVPVTHTRLEILGVFIAVTIQSHRGIVVVTLMDGLNAKVEYKKIGMSI